MTDWTGPMTLLRAVNMVLKGMGEPSINSLVGAALDAQSALETIQEVSFKLQSKGWTWNHEKHNLSPDASGEIKLPTNIARIDTVDGDKPIEVVQRGQRLFKKDGATYQFSKAIQVEMWVVLPFEDLSNTAKIYVAATAAMHMQQQLIGSDTLDKDLKAAALDAWQDLQRDELEVGDYNMLTGSYSVASILDRSGRSFRGGR